MSAPLKSPYPYFGGKSRVASLVWERLGNVPNYVEPFFGSGAVLLARPHEPKVETVNDMDAYLTNFWRALQADPEGVANWCDQPVNELDLHSRHGWLRSKQEYISRMRTDPDFYDIQIAGWWVWGISCWIGDKWCQEETQQAPCLGNAGMGISRGELFRRPHLGGQGGGCGVQRMGLATGGRPHCGRNQGIHAGFRTDGIYQYLNDLAKRVRRVRVCCGDWSRVMGDSVTIFHGLTGVFLDPPYFSPDRDDCYNHDSRTLPKDVERWAIANGDNPLFRIALCGHEGDYDMPNTWDCFAWKAGGGYGNRNQANTNATKERIWFSPHCLQPAKQLTLFDLEQNQMGATP